MAQLGEDQRGMTEDMEVGPGRRREDSVCVGVCGELCEGVCLGELRAEGLSL